VKSAERAAAAPPPAPDRQLAHYEAAMRLFHARQFAEARQSFVRAAEGPEPAVSHRAVLHLRMCDQRLQRAAPVLVTAEDYYNYGVALINSRDLARAREALARAVEMNPAADHFYYALALCHALSGDYTAAYEYLKRAIDMNPLNRVAARQDADFSTIVNQPPFDLLLCAERKPH
jgi:tetratricopeptide (TPR) repeat protein